MLLSMMHACLCGKYSYCKLYYIILSSHAPPSVALSAALHIFPGEKARKKHETSGRSGTRVIGPVQGGPPCPLRPCGRWNRRGIRPPASPPRGRRGRPVSPSPAPHGQAGRRGRRREEEEEEEEEGRGAGGHRWRGRQSPRGQDRYWRPADRHGLPSCGRIDPCRPHPRRESGAGGGQDARGRY